MRPSKGHRLAKEAQWRDDETFTLLNGLFENEWETRRAGVRLVALEFQGQLAGRIEPLNVRAARLLERLSDREDAATLRRQKRWQTATITDGPKSPR